MSSIFLDPKEEMITNLLKNKNKIGDVTDFTSYEALIKKIDEIAKTRSIAEPIIYVVSRYKAWCSEDPLIPSKRNLISYLDNVKEDFPRIGLLQRLLLDQFESISIHLIKKKK